MGEQSKQFDPDAAAVALKLDERTKQFALAMLRGASQWESGVEAGLSGAPGPGEQPSFAFRKKCSVKAKSQRVAKFLAAAGGDVAVDDLPAGPLTDAERRLILAEAARKGTGGIRVRAALADYQIGRGSQEAKAEDNPAAALALIAEISPEIAGLIAARHGVEFEADKETRQKAEDYAAAAARKLIADNPHRAREIANYFLQPVPRNSNVVPLER